MTSPPAAWYPAPDGEPGRLRYWDGQQWTEHVAPLPVEPEPPRQRVRHPALIFVPVLVVNLCLGVPAYFIAFLFAYGFEESIGLGNHVAFLTLITIFAVTTGELAAVVPLGARPRPSTARRAAAGALASLALNAAVVGAGSIVSAAHKDDGSVSAHFSTSTDATLATVLFVLAIVFAGAALRVQVRRADVSGSGSHDTPER